MFIVRSICACSSADFPSFRISRISWISSAVKRIPFLFALVIRASMTAISLLFAIQNLKPSPFCLLDEIEAALDDSNVGRYAQYLHKLTEHTQFIVITHRRGTMAAADRLYGITMQEKGVSTLVSVDLLEDDLVK